MEIDLPISAWHLWVAAGAMLCLLEIKLPGFVVFWLGVGALAAAVPAGLGLGAIAQVAVFSAVSLSLFALSRTLFKRFFIRSAKRVRTGVEAMVGAEATVVEALGEPGDGVVRINGELWAARCLGGPLAKGEVAVVERLEGLKLLVRRPGELRQAASGTTVGPVVKTETKGR